VTQISFSSVSLIAIRNPRRKGHTYRQINRPRKDYDQDQVGTFVIYWMTSCISTKHINGIEIENKLCRKQAKCGYNI